MDKQTVEIVSIILGVAGLIGAITKYNSPNSRKAYYGENLYAVKADIIDNSIAWGFTILAVIGLIPQLIMSIYGDEIADRIFNDDHYLRISLAFIFSAVILSVVLLRICHRIAKLIWFPELVKKLKPQFHQAWEILQREELQDKKEARTRKEEQDHDLMQKIFAAIEKHLELENYEGGYRSRADKLRHYFDKFD